MAALHPQVVHFAIVLTMVGVAFRIVSLFRWAAFASPAATVLLLLAAVSAYVSAESGTAAHGPVERAPGARPAVTAHEEWGERTEFIVIALGAVELLAVVLRRSPKVRFVRWASAAVGVAAVVSVYQTGRLGGELVYAYAGGVGIRSGDPQDVERLLLAGYYHEAMAARKAGRSGDAADLISAAAKRFPTDPEVALLAAESQLRDRHDPQAALSQLTGVTVPDGNRFLRLQMAFLKADALEAAGQRDAAVVELEALRTTFPTPRIQQRIDELKKNPEGRE
jgi:uncharacterized membrane protein